MKQFNNITSSFRDEVTRLGQKASMERPDGRARRVARRDSKEKTLNLVDVYDIAADIGKVSPVKQVRGISIVLSLQEFEHLIDHHGAEEVTSLMQKVISALEHLEQLVQNSETELQMIEDLRKTIEHLEHEDNKKADERLKYARDIEQVEEHYKVRLLQDLLCSLNYFLRLRPKIT